MDTEVTSIAGQIRTARVLELCDCSKATLNRWIKSGDFPQPIRYSANCNRFDVREVMAFLESRKAQRAAPDLQAA